MNEFEKERFSWQGNEVTVLSSGSNIDDNVQKTDQRLQVGDVVSLKGRRYLVCVESLNYKLSEDNIIDYVGSIVDFKSSQPVFFYQHDIEKKHDNLESVEFVNPIAKK